MTRKGFPSRAVLLSLSIVVLTVAVALLVLSHSRSEGAHPESVAPTPSPSAEGRPLPLETTAESASTRADVEEHEEGRSTSPVGSRTLVVAGVVLDAPSRAVVPNIEIEASAGPIPRGKNVRATATSDAQGRYSLQIAIPADLPWDATVWAVGVTASGDRFREVRHQLGPAHFRPDPTTEGTFFASQDIEIELLLALRGRLVRESDGTPIAGGTATLLLLAQAPTVPRSIADAKTEEDGRFLIQMKTVEPGDRAVLGSASGFLAKMVPAFLDPARAVDVGDIALGEGACLEGFVTTANGSVPAATRVYASTRARGDAWLHLQAGAWAVRNGAVVPRDAHAPIGPDGGFRLCGLAPDEYFLSVSYPGCSMGSRLESLDIRAPASGVRIQLTRAVYRLHVFDAQSGDELSRSRFLFDGPQEHGCYIEAGYMVVTDPGIESPGKIVAEGFRVLKCTLPALLACEIRDLEFRLQPLPHLIACTIVVTSPTGAPVEDVEVEIRSDATEVDGQGPMPKLSHSAPDGRHELPKLVPGTYHLAIEPRREWDPSAELWLGATLEMNVREGMEPIRVQLGEGGLVRATVTKTDGEPVDANTSLVRTPESPPESIDWRNDAGSFVGWIPKGSIVRLAQPLPAGRWTLRFEADGCTSQDVVVDVDAGRTTAIQVSLEPSGPR